MVKAYLTVLIAFLLIVSPSFAATQSHPVSQLGTTDAQRDSNLNLGSYDIILNMVKGYTGSRSVSLLETSSNLFGLTLGSGGFSCSSCVGLSDVDTSEVQRRVGGACTGTDKMVRVNQDGSVTCAADVDTDTIHHDHWTLKANSDTGSTVSDGTSVNFQGSGATTVSRSGTTITISSTDNDNDHHDDPSSHPAAGNINVNGNNLDNVDTINFENGKNLEWYSTYIRSNGQLMATRFWSTGDIIAEGVLTIQGTGTSSFSGQVSAPSVNIQNGGTFSGDNNGFIVSSGGFKTSGSKAIIAGGSITAGGHIYAHTSEHLDTGDAAEPFAYEGSIMEEGDVVVLVPEKTNSNLQTVKISDKPYDNLVMGVVSPRATVVLASGNLIERGIGVGVSVAGVTFVKVIDENGPIHPGDILTTSSTPGYAMKCHDKIQCIGSTIGKAMESHLFGQGKIKVLVNAK